MSIEHYRDTSTGLLIGEIPKNILNSIGDSGRAVLAVVGIAVTGIPEAIRNITAKEPAPSAVNIPASQTLTYRG